MTVDTLIEKLQYLSDMGYGDEQCVYDSVWRIVGARYDEEEDLVNIY